MPYVKNKSYRSMPFSPETPKEDFYICLNVAELAEKSETYKEEMFNCRTVGILHSANGRFFLTDLESPTLKEDTPMLRITMAYLQSPPKSAVIPYPVQVFGTLQWKNRPVVFAKILQTLSAPWALRLRNAMSAVVKTHLARPALDEDIFSDDDDIT